MHTTKSMLCVVLVGPLVATLANSLVDHTLFVLVVERGTTYAARHRDCRVVPGHLPCAIASRLAEAFAVVAAGAAAGAAICGR